MIPRTPEERLSARVSKAAEYSSRQALGDLREAIDRDLRIALWFSVGSLFVSGFALGFAVTNALGWWGGP